MSHCLSKKLLVVIPHAGIACPPEISQSMLSCHQKTLESNIDWYTEHLYDFQDLLGNAQVIFPYSQVYINVNRHPKTVDECIPLSLDGLPVYAAGREPSLEQRNSMMKRHLAFHRRITNHKKTFILDGHSADAGHKDAEGNQFTDDIIIGDRQASVLDPPGGLRTAPPGYLETYVEELERGFSGFNLSIACNTTYSTTYAHVMALHGWDGQPKKERRVPLLCQETNQSLYMKDGIPDGRLIEELRRIFAQALDTMLNKLQ